MILKSILMSSRSNNKPSPEWSIWSNQTMSEQNSKFWNNSKSISWKAVHKDNALLSLHCSLLTSNLLMSSKPLKLKVKTLAWTGKNSLLSVEMSLSHYKKSIPNLLWNCTYNFRLLLTNVMWNKNWMNLSMILPLNLWLFIKMNWVTPMSKRKLSP